MPIWLLASVEATLDTAVVTMVFATFDIVGVVTGDVPAGADAWRPGIGDAAGADSPEGPDPVLDHRSVKLLSFFVDSPGSAVNTVSCDTAGRGQVCFEPPEARLSWLLALTLLRLVFIASEGTRRV